MVKLLPSNLTASNNKAQILYIYRNMKTSNIQKVNSQSDIQLKMTRHTKKEESMIHNGSGKLISRNNTNDRITTQGY